jgi:hypothetical protein
MAIDLAAKHSCVVQGGSLDEMHFRVVASPSRENGAARWWGAEAFQNGQRAFAGLHDSLID